MLLSALASTNWVTPAFAASIKVFTYDSGGSSLFSVAVVVSEEYLIGAVT